LIALLTVGGGLFHQTAGAAEPAAGQVVVLEFEGVVEVARAGSAVWQPASTNLELRAEDRLRTGRRSRAVVRLSEYNTLRMGELGLLQMPPERTGPFGLWRGLFYFFHRDKPGTIPARTPTTSTLVRGTEFNVQVEETGRTTLSLIDGEVEMTNEFGRLALRSGEAGVVEPGQAPRRAPMIEAINVIQWALYYPAVLDAEEVPFTVQELAVLQESLAALRSGDLRAALDRYPADRQPGSDAERVYRAALLLGAGQVASAQAALEEVRGPRSEVSRVEDRLAEALRKLIAAVKFQPGPSTLDPRPSPPLASEFLAESYYRQSRFDLEGARAATLRATELAPQSGLAWARLAELQFSFGRVVEAKAALRRGLELSPRNAQAHALQGFLLSAENRTAQAIASFEQAMALDGALGNAWLGRGLCQIRRGHAEEGRQDLQVAATLEPQRALLRSYLGKAFSQVSDLRHAEQEVALAQKLDPRDPTAWLYSALLRQQENRINEAVRDLERSQELNENRRLYRSQLLLDQDRAVRGANLANVYRDAGMTDVSVREAGRAVNTDYANFSSHLFLADS
jgi:tetratricopeptide (TPR) repeat protein